MCDSASQALGKALTTHGWGGCDCQLTNGLATGGAAEAEEVEVTGARSSS